MKQNVYVSEILTTEFVANKGLNRNSALADEEGGETPCGVAKRAFRKALEYFPQSTPTHSAQRRGTLPERKARDTEQKTETELQSLKLTGDFFKKIVIRMDIPHNFYDNNGFYHCNLIDFLLGTTTLF